MADVVTDVSKLNGWFKSKHGTFQDNIPDVAKFTGGLAFTKAQRVGRNFNFPVELSLPQGVTYAAAGAGAFDFEDAVAGEMKEATIDGSQIVVQDVLDYESAAKAVAEGDEAYGDAGERMVRRMRKSGHKRIELSAWYGQTTLGKVGAASTSGSTRVLTISDDTWAAGIWTGMKNMKLDVDTDGTFATQINTNAAMTITKVDVANKQITVSGADYASILAGHYLVPRNSVTFGGTPAHKQMAGLDKIITNTGTLFGISASDYELWAGNSFAVGSVPLTLKKVNDAVCDPVSKGLDEEATVWVSTRTWGNLCSDQAAMRKYDAQYTSSKATNGFRALTMFSQNGELKIMPHTIIKEGEAWIATTERFLKIGAQDLGFNVPGRGEQYFENLSAKAGYRLMAYAHLAIICGAPGMCTKLTGIVNS